MVSLVLAIVSLWLAASSQASVLAFRNYASSVPIDPGSVPSQCQPYCTPIINELNACSDLTCLCTTANGQNLEGCLDCIVSLSDTVDVATNAQALIDEFMNECTNAGILLPSISLSPSSISVAATSTSVVGALTTASPTGGVPQTSVFFTPSSGAAAATGTSGSGSSSNPFRNGVLGRSMGAYGLVGVLGVGLVSVVVVLMV